MNVLESRSHPSTAYEVSNLVDRFGTMPPWNFRVLLS